MARSQREWHTYMCLQIISSRVKWIVALNI